VNLLITRHDKIGDFVLTLPTYKVAHEQMKNVKVIALVSKVNYNFAKSIKFIDDVILYDEDIFTLIKNIKEKNIDVSISAFTDTKLALALLLSGVKKRYAPATKIAQIFSNHRVKQRRSQVKKTEAQYNLELLTTFDNNIKPEFNKPLLEYSAEEKIEQLNNFKNQFDIQDEYKYVGFHPGFGGSSDGNLVIDDYISLARCISKEENVKVVFTFGPDDLENKKYIEDHIDFDVILFESKLSLLNFCKLLSNFEVFVSTSTGPMHLAGSVNIKTISFFGDSLFASAKRWATISQTQNQNNYSIPVDYDESLYKKIENRLKEIV